MTQRQLTLVRQNNFRKWLHYQLIAMDACLFRLFVVDGFPGGGYAQSKDAYAMQLIVAVDHAIVIR